VGNRIKNLQPDIVVVRFWIPFMGPSLGTISRIINKNKHTKIVCLADNVIPHEHRPGDKAFTSWFVKPVDRFAVMSRQVMEDLKKFTSKPTVLLPHPLYDNFGNIENKQEARNALLEQFNISISNSDKLLVFFGLVRNYKGLDILLNALALTADKEIKLLVAGEFYEDEKPYRELVENLHLQQRVIIHNKFINGEDVKHFICAADCVVQPYRSATQSGVTPVAYHFEKPMIVTNVGGLPEMVPHNIAGLVSEPDASSLAKAIDDYFKKGSGYFMPGLLEEKKKLSWARMVEELVG